MTTLDLGSVNLSLTADLLCYSTLPERFTDGLKMSFIKSRAVLISQLGDPTKVLKLVTQKVPLNLGTTDVLVKWLASPINPLDINRIQGVYPGSQSDVVGGSEALGVVEKSGSEAKLKPNDLVIPISLGGQLWSEYDVIDESSLYKVRPDIDLLSGAVLLVNPPTAYVMLKHFVKLQPGDYIIQNSANSGVGRAVIEIAHAWGYKSINLIRDRPEVDKLKNELRQLGADFVYTEDEFKKIGSSIAKEYDIKLAFNGVGGRSALMISSSLAFGGTIVTYGGMSKKASEISTSSFVFRNIKACGVAVGNWMMMDENKAEVSQMLEELQQLIVEGKLHPPPVELHELNDFGEAISRTVDGKHCKQVLLIHPDHKNYKQRPSKL
uniref:Enoyl-[acyl-carrier-protein] reductase, mitochondrial n=1 Tax=Panagrellus redivivus TaxID=6233 RepID=A0A7E4UYN8_PANRE